MNSEDYAQWEKDAQHVLQLQYTAEEIAVILAWFRRIKSDEECELIGHEEVEAMLVFSRARDNFNLYNCLMARLFIYAPLILREHGAVISLDSFKKLMSALSRVADKVKEQPAGWSKIRASREYERLQRACKNLVAAGKGKVTTSEGEFKSLVNEFCNGESRPSHTIYAGDLQYIFLAERKLWEAYEAALAAVADGVTAERN